jgi:hypothetical protein
MASVALDAAHAPAVALASSRARSSRVRVDRRQIIVDAVDTVTGEMWRGRSPRHPHRETRRLV